jgi:hypothetical protein
MQKKYVYAAMKGLTKNLDVVEKQFKKFVKASGIADTIAASKAPVGDEYWEPPAWNSAVCCMKGMKCWTG